MGTETLTVKLSKKQVMDIEYLARLAKADSLLAIGDPGKMQIQNKLSEHTGGVLNSIALSIAGAKAKAEISFDNS